MITGELKNKVDGIWDIFGRMAWQTHLPSLNS